MSTSTKPRQQSSRAQMRDAFEQVELWAEIARDLAYDHLTTRQTYPNRDRVLRSAVQAIAWSRHARRELTRKPPQRVAINETKRKKR